MSACGKTRSSQVALSRDLFRVAYACGDVIRLWRPDTGRWHRYVVWDTMARGPRRTADILMPTREAALRFGRREGRLLGP